MYDQEKTCVQNHTSTVDTIWTPIQDTTLLYVYDSFFCIRSVFLYKLPTKSNISNIPSYPRTYTQYNKMELMMELLIKLHCILWTTSINNLS